MTIMKKEKHKRKLTEEHKAKIVRTGQKQSQRQKELVADANSMKWLVHNLSTGKKETICCGD